MRTDVFDFHLPPERIALRPASPRDSARMLVVDADGRHSDHVVSQLPNFLRAHDVLVVNDTRVIAAQLSGRRIARASIASSSEADPGSREENPSNKTSHPAIHATLIKRLDGSHWQALVRPAKKLVAGDLVRFGSDGRVCLLGNLDATVESKGDNGEVTLAFAFDGPMLDQAIAEVGVTPLPPYIASKRNLDAQDATDYQTMFATEEGAVAAPTAGLHFTTALYDAVQSRGVGIERVTLHVGAGTFLPVKVEDTAGHVMHAEYGLVSESVCERLNAAKSAGGRIIAVGTTSLRLLESATGEDGIVRPFAGETAIFITPGYRFRCVDVLMTNFHLPRSTLVMLISAFSGIAPIRSAYAHAIASGYRFYSYGDASLLLRAP